MTIEKIIKTEKIRRHKKISVLFILLPFIWLLCNWSIIDALISKIFLYIVTMFVGWFVISLLDAHYNDKIDEIFKAEWFSFCFYLT